MGVFLFLLCALAARAQLKIIPTVITVAGNGSACSTATSSCGDGGAATSANLNNAQHVMVDTAGNLYISDNSDNRVRKVTATTGIISTIAGNGTQCAASTNTCGDGGAATSANLYYPNATALDSAGNLYIVDRKDNRIRMVAAATGIITTVAGNGTACASSTNTCGDGGAATSANLNTPIDIAVDSTGNLYIADDLDNRIRKVTAGTGIITTVAGNGTACAASTSTCGDGGAATSANLWLPRGIAVDSAGDLYISDNSDNRIRKVTASTGYISTIVGNGTACAATTDTCGDGGAPTSANLYRPANIVLDGAGNLYIGDQQDNRVRMVSAVTGLITTVAGTGTQCAATTNSCGDGAAATSSTFYNPTGVAIDQYGNLFIADDDDNRIRKVMFALDFPDTAVGSSIAENVLLETTSAETLTSFTAQQSQGSTQEFTLGSVSGCTVNGSTSNSSGTTCTIPITFSPSYPGLRKVPLTAVTGNGSMAFGLAGMGVGPAAFMIPGIISTIAGTGTAGYSGDGAAATAAKLNGAQRVAVDGAGNVYIADSTNNVIRKVTATTGYISTVAGTGTASFSGDGAAATLATLNNPVAVAVDGAGNLYIADLNNNRIREVNAATGKISTVAGTGTQGYSGDGGAATSAKLDEPFYVAVDLAGNLDIVDGYNCRIRRVTPSTGIISTIVGNGTCGYAGDGGLATSAEINLAGAIAIDDDNNLYIADSLDYRVRMVSSLTGLISTIAGTGSSGYSGDGGSATSATIGQVEGIAVDTIGNLYLPDGANHRVRRIDTTTGFISTIAGNGTSGTTGDSGAATSAELKDPYDVAIDAVGSLFIADLTAEVIRKVTVNASALTYATSTAVGTSDATDNPQTVTVVNIGNSDLTVSPPSSGSNPSVTTNFTLDSSTTCPELYSASSAQTLASAASCTYGVNFAATNAGSVSGSAVLTDDSLGVTGTTQSISLSATGVAVSTMTSLATSGTPAVYGGSVTLTATVVPTVGTALPLGTVQFKVNGVAVGSAVTLNASGVATYTTTTLTAGTNSVTAVYTTTSSNFIGSTSSALSQVVNQATPSITWGSPTAITYGTALSGTQLSASTGISGSFVYTPASGAVLSAGSHTLSVTFTPTDTTDYATVTATNTLTVNAATGTIVLTSSASSVSYGASLTITATLPATASGTVTFLNGGITLGTATISSGTATFTVSTLSVGSHTLTATWPGDTNYTSATSNSLAQTVVRVAATVGFTSGRNPSIYGDKVTLSVVLTGPNTTPTGTVTLTDSGTTISTLSLSGGTATYSSSTLSSGSHSLKITYNGDTNFY